MSASKRIAFAVAVSWFNRLITILANLFFIPILFRFVGKEELGIWFLLSNSQLFLSLMGFGIAPTLTRYIAFAKGKSGSQVEIELTQESQQEILDWVETGKILLRGLAIIIFFVAWGIGDQLIGQLELKEVSPQTVFIAWTLICFSYAIGVWVKYLNCWLQGIGYVGWDSLISTILTLLTILTNILAVMLGGGLLALATITVIFAILQRFFFIFFIRWRKPELFKNRGNWQLDYAKKMLRPSLMWWFTELGTFLMLRTDTYFIALLKGAANIPIYQASYQLVSNLKQIAISFTPASSVFISQAWQAGDFKTIHNIVIRNAKLGMSILAVGVGFLLVSGQDVISLWLGKENVLQYGILVIFHTTLTLQSQTMILTYSARATDDEKYASWTMTAGFLNIIFTFFLTQKLGLLGVALGTLCAQTLTTHWYGVYRGLTRLQIPFQQYFSQVLGVYMILLGSSYLLCWSVKQGLMQLGISSLWLIVFIPAVFAAILWIGTGWLYLLDRSQKRAILAKLGLSSRI